MLKTIFTILIFITCLSQSIAGFNHEIAPKVTLVEYLSSTHNIDIKLVERIIDCESELYQGSINHNRREDGSIWSTDYGLFQINDYFWNKKALKLGLNYKESREDNIKLGFYILEVQGLSAWRASSHCWK
jgi:hypothetical protein